MNITLNSTDRKPLVKAISELTGRKGSLHEDTYLRLQNWRLHRHQRR